MLAARAVPDRGGQGLNLRHMVEGLGGDFDLELMCCGGWDGRRAEIIPPSRLSKCIGGVPYVRRLRNLQGYFEDKHFDESVAARLGPAEIFQGVTGQCLLSLKRAAALGCRTLLDVVTLHVDDFARGQASECARFGIRPSMHAWQRKRILEEYERADLIRVMSPLARETFAARGFPEEKLSVVQPPLALEEFQPANFAAPKFTVSFVGLLEPWKGFHYLVEAFDKLNLRDSELVLWGGPGSRSVSRYLAESMARNPRIVLRPVEVRRLGYDKVYGQSSVLVHPSLSDGFGYVVAEAMASGIPVIVTRNTGAACLVRDGVNGYVVPPADSEAIRDRLSHLAANPALLKEMGRAARQTAGALTRQNFRRQYAACLNSLIG